MGGIRVAVHPHRLTDHPPQHRERRAECRGQREERLPRRLRPRLPRRTRGHESGLDEVTAALQTVATVVVRLQIGVDPLHLCGWIGCERGCNCGCRCGRGYGLGSVPRRAAGRQLAASGAERGHSEPAAADGRQGKLGKQTCVGTSAGQGDRGTAAHCSPGPRAVGEFRILWPHAHYILVLMSATS